MGATGDKIKGKANEVTGKVKGDRKQEMKGKAQQTKGDAKDRFEAERQDVKDDPDQR